MDVDEALDRLLSELESLHCSSSAGPLSDASLQLLSGYAGDRLWDLLAARRLSPSYLLRLLSATMDAASLPAAFAYLSLLLLPSSPISSLFSPLPLLSLLRCLRLSSKPQSQASEPPSRPRKRKPSARSQMPQPDLHALFLQVLESLELVLSRVRLDANPDGRRSLVETLTGILTSTHHRVPDQCFRILYVVISRPEHGDQTSSAVEVLRHLSPIILSSTRTPSRGLALGFVTGKVAPLSRENELIRKPFVYLPRLLATKAPEKSEPRSCAVDAIMEVVKAMEYEDRIGFAQYVMKMALGKPQLRLLAVDLILALLSSSPDSLGGENDWGIRCLNVMAQRCSDSVGGIRARALTNMAQIIGVLSMDDRNFDRLREVVAFGSMGFVQLLRKRCMDEKAAVRKAALLLVTKSTSLIGRPVDDLILKTMGAACFDPLVSIRKAALTALSEVYRRFPESSVISEWLHAVPRMIVDNETSIQEECENLFLELVFDWISNAGKVSLNSDTMVLESLFPEGLLALLKGICDAEVAPCIKKICASLGKKKKLRRSIASSLQNIILSSEALWLRNSMPIEKWTAPAGAWQLLAEVSLFTPKAIDWKFLHHHWQLLDKSNLKGKCKMSDGMEPNSALWAGDRVFLLQTISNVSLELPPEPAADLAHNLLRRIEDFNMCLSEVDAHVKALKTLCKQKAMNPEEGDTLILKWVYQLVSKSLKILDDYMSDISDASKVNSFLTPPQSGRRKRKIDLLESVSAQMAVTAVFTIGSLILVCPSADLQGIIPLLHTIITSGSPEAKTNKLSRKLPSLTFSVREKAPSLYTQSWVTMGKICLVDGKLAKRYIPLFVQELEKSNCAALRNNIMMIMADFCVQYTALVDCYIPKITASLRDSCEIVRRQTFILLSRLLQRDYVKWKGVLFLRFLLSLVDESEKIRHLADFLFGSILKVKAPLLAYNSFVEAIFVLNDCHAHASYENQGGLQKGAQNFSLRGNDEKSRSQRMHIYLSLLKQMAPEHLLATSAKLCAEILAAASDGLLNIDDVTGQCVLQDALQILACKEMRLHSNRAHETTDMDDEGGDSGGNTLLAARGRVVTQVAKKNLIQIAVPIFIELKRLLQSKNSPLTGCLMDCLRVLLKDYKNEIDEILVADKQLQKELIYDMQKYENAKVKSTVADTVAAVQKSAGYNSPGNRTTTNNIYSKVSEKVGSGQKMACAVADAAARATARSVLKVYMDAVTPPLHTMSVPKLKSNMFNAGSSRDKPVDVIESLRRRQSFDSDDER